MRGNIFMATTWKEYELNATAIEEISESLQSYLNDLGEISRNVQRNRLVLEELLLRIRDAYDAPVKLSVMIGKHFGRHVIKLSYSGAAFDPTDTEAENNSILETIGLAPMWGYRKNTNTVSMTISGKVKRGRLFKILVAIVLAGVLGYLGKYLPEGFRSTVDESILSPMISCFLGLLATFAGFMIALTITSGVLGVGDSSALSRIGKRVILRFFLITLLTATVALLAAYPFFNLVTGDSGQGAPFQLKSILSMFFDILPTNPVDPFLSGNSLQIIVIGLFVGVALLALGERTKVIRDFVQEGASLTQWLTSTVCSMVPVFVFVALLHQVWSGSASLLLSVWRPMLIIVGVSLVWMTILLLYTSFRVKCSPIRLLKKAIPAFVIGITTGSSMTAFTTAIATCKDQLGIDESYVKFSYPMGNVMYMQGTVMYLTVICLFFAETFDVKVSLMWFAMTILTASLLAIAVPPIPGAALMLFTILFSQLGIPEDALVIAAAMDIVFDFVDTGLNIFALILEVTSGAHSMKRIDHEVLRRPATGRS